MTRERGLTLIELMLSLVLITVVSGAVFPTLVSSARSARIVDARMEDADGVSRARRRLAIDLRAAANASVRDAELILSIDGTEVVWRTGTRGLTRTEDGRVEDVCRRVHEITATVHDAQVDVVLATPTARRALTVVRRTGDAL